MTGREKEKVGPDQSKDGRQGGLDERKSGPGERKPGRTWAQSEHRAYPDPIDDTLDGSFPASDPPSWAGR